MANTFSPLSGTTTLVATTTATAQDPVPDSATTKGHPALEEADCGLDQSGHRRMA